MIFAFGNNKGGTGSTTLSLLMAHYLSNAGHLSVSLVELKEGSALGLFYERSLLLEHQLPFEFFSCDLAHLEPLLLRLAGETSIILLDLPGGHYDQDILRLLARVDYLIIPFSYDRATLHDSIYYAAFARRAKPMISLLFIPNRIQSHAPIEHRGEAEGVLRKLGAVSPAISEHVGFARISSLRLPDGLLARTVPILDLICEQYLNLPEKKEL